MVIILKMTNTDDYWKIIDNWEMKCLLHKHLHFGARILGELDGSAGWALKKLKTLGVFIFVCIKMFIFLPRSVYFVVWDGTDNDS